MMFEPSDDIIDSDPEDDMDEPPAFGSDVERNVVLHRRAQQVVYAVNLQRMARHLRHSWAFSIALDSATHQSTSYLDLRF
ncbi:unnamed protein product [Sphagnum troendelagicum]|uniref:Uncharacterized protein n=1 Tax=Sphagnum troendelagicum TaxID=128251 RepID=A0ABP0THI9_9BRYO